MPKIKNPLVCDCCGSEYHDKDPQRWVNVKDFIHGTQFGVCEKCEGWIEEKNEKKWQRHEASFLSFLEKDENKERFLAMEKEVRRGLILQAIEEGIVDFKIGAIQ
jgi:hypothetical protein